MNRIGRLIRLTATLAMLTAFACVASSCVTEAGDCPPEEPSHTKEVFKFSFRLCSRISDSDTKANDIEEGSVAEDMINVNDIAYYLFDRERKFLCQLKPTATVTTLVSENYAIYEVVAKIGNDDDPSDYFRIHWNSQTDFYILALANYSGYSATIPQLNAGDNLDDLMNGKSTTMQALPDTEKILKGATSPDNDGKSVIPMAGLQLFSINGSWFETQTGEAPIDLTFITGKSLNMLRSMAKLEVIDKINLKPGTKYDRSTGDNNIRIAEIALNGIMKNALLLPTANQWIYNGYGETRQVQNASVSVSDDYAQPGTDGSILNFFYDERETLRRADRCPVYSCYVWEYMRPDNLPGDKIPSLSVKVRNALNPTTQKPDQPDETYSVALCKDMSAGATEHTPIQSILRNHIYRYEITAIAADLSIEWSVCPMDEASADITFN